MFDNDDNAERRPFDPVEKAKAKSDEFRMHAELVAVFEGLRKCNAELNVRFNADVARSLQQSIGKLERLRITDTPLLSPDAYDEARVVFNTREIQSLAKNDYHISRRPGETLIFRWISGDQADFFFERLQAHFDAALNQFRDDERQAKGWQQDDQLNAYLEKLDELKVSMTERYLRSVLKEHGLFALSTQAADEIDILHLCDLIMGVPAAEVVGSASAPKDESETERAWYFKLYSLRGWVQQQESLFFLAFLQKASDSFD